MLASFHFSLVFFLTAFKNCLFENGLLQPLPSFIPTVPQLVKDLLAKLLLCSTVELRFSNFIPEGYSEAIGSKTESPLFVTGETHD